MKWIVGWGAVPYCNMSCEFCYSKYVREEGDMLNLQQWQNFVSSNCDHIESINYGTGESTMCNDWYDLVYFISTSFPQITQALTTNGYISSYIKENPNSKHKFFSSIHEVDVSLDFYQRDKHNAFRGQRNAFEWAINTLELCKNHNIVATLVFVGTNETLEIENLEGLFRIAAMYNAKIRLNIFRPINGINSHSQKYVADFHVIMHALEWINDNHKVLSIDDSLFSALLIDDSANFGSVKFNNSLRILHDGSITPSTYLVSKEFRKLSILESSVLSKIESSDLLIPEVVPAECAGCIYEQKCKGGVYDRRYLWNGTFNSRDSYCPFIDARREIPKFSIKLSKIPFSSVHHGYLPTMFFEPQT